MTQTKAEAAKSQQVKEMTLFVHAWNHKSSEWFQPKANMPCQHKQKMVCQYFWYASSTQFYTRPLWKFTWHVVQLLDQMVEN